jgi:hypothetical protein
LYSDSDKMYFNFYEIIFNPDFKINLKKGYII